jgi:hypothetical protein
MHQQRKLPILNGYALMTQSITGRPIGGKHADLSVASRHSRTQEEHPRREGSKQSNAGALSHPATDN